MFLLFSKDAIMCLYFVPNGYPMLNKAQQIIVTYMIFT